MRFKWSREQEKILTRVIWQKSGKSDKLKRDPNRSLYDERM